ncbi:MAG TPA: PDZ domain-containing protein, partial [Bacillota bacterium]|nr:PDZ domain-containing protein [Bacillota bacterium]
MLTSSGATIKAVEAGSIAEELEIEAGDILLGINGEKLLDYIDFLFYSSEEELSLEIQKKSGEIVEIEFEKDSVEPLGLVFEEVVFDRTRECSNHCLFCFVHQLPPGQRSTLYVQDDDYRLSFLHGCYITLTNLSEADWQRIERLHLSPLYISVHATDPAVRRKLLGSKAGGLITEQLRRLGRAGIQVH